MPRNRVITASTNLTTATETIVGTLGPLTANKGQNFDLFATMNLLSGSAAALYVIRIRRGSTTGGTDLTGGVVQMASLATTNVVASAAASDQLATDEAGQMYVVTVQQSSGQTCGANNVAFFVAW